MSSRRLTAAVVGALLLAVPAPGLAQTAGDEQYQDPFAEETAPPGTDEEGQLSDEPPGLGSTPPDGIGVEGYGSDPGAEPEAPPSGDTTAGGTELPDTGAEAMLMAMLGSGLLLTGTGLRLRLRAGARG